MTQIQPQPPLPQYLDEAELEAAIHGIAKHHVERSRFLFLVLLLLGIWGMWLRSQPVKTAKTSELQSVAAAKLAYPVDAPITSRYGTRKHPITGEIKMHSGVDFGAAQGTPIRAAAGGKVTFVGWAQGYGNSVEIDHGNSDTFYAHASVLYVQPGQRVKPGQAIAAVGSTGNSTGPHLHFEVREEGQLVDPMKFLEKNNDAKPVGKTGTKRVSD